MTDLEMTTLCAEAMGLKVEQTAPRKGRGVYIRFRWDADKRGVYRPLTDDAQAMALVKKMSIQIHHHGYAGAKASLTTVSGRLRLDDHPTKITGTDLNRAIVECVAKMQASKSSGDKQV